MWKLNENIKSDEVKAPFAKAKESACLGSWKEN